MNDLYSLTRLFRSEEMLEKEARRPELLVPISVDFDVPSNSLDQLGIKVKDRFLWNMNGMTHR